MKLNKNIVFIGMMGYGKSTIGFFLSKSVNFNDTFFISSFLIFLLDMATLSEVFFFKLDDLAIFFSSLSLSYIKIITAIHIIIKLISLYKLRLYPH